MLQKKGIQLACLPEKSLHGLNVASVVLVLLAGRLTNPYGLLEFIVGLSLTGVGGELFEVLRVELFIV